MSLDVQRYQMAGFGGKDAQQPRLARRRLRWQRYDPRSAATRRQVAGLALILAWVAALMPVDERPIVTTMWIMVNEPGPWVGRVVFVLPVLGILIGHPRIRPGWLRDSGSVFIVIAAGLVVVKGVVLPSLIDMPLRPQGHLSWGLLPVVVSLLWAAWLLRAGPPPEAQPESTSHDHDDQTTG
ncbi:MAG: hypothetical protein CSA84_01820 [Actinomycetales bacterium]|nr:MAG: hypothetical protein CSA84_01820 [Actinomycetales bacterium]